MGIAFCPLCGQGASPAQAATLIGTLLGWAYVLLAVVFLGVLASSIFAFAMGKGPPRVRLATLGTGAIVISVLFAFTPSVLQSIKLPIPMTLNANQAIPLPLDLYKGTEVIGSYSSDGHRHGGVNDDIDIIITGPKGQTLFSKIDSSEGSFRIDAVESGIYTLKVDNTGLFRMTGRTVVFSISIIPWWAKGLGRWWYLCTLFGLAALIAGIVWPKPLPKVDKRDSAA